MYVSVGVEVGVSVAVDVGRGVLVAAGGKVASTSVGVSVAVAVGVISSAGNGLVASVRGKVRVVSSERVMTRLTSPVGIVPNSPRSIKTGLDQKEIRPCTLEVKVRTLAVSKCP